jgi:hypothetical protein
MKMKLLIMPVVVLLSSQLFVMAATAQGRNPALDENITRGQNPLL